jgi:hypothetical protein
MRWRLISDRDRGAPDRGDGGTEAAFWASPVGEAARAKLRGDRFFQIELDDETLTAYAESATTTAGGRRVRRTCDLLGQIEELGWHLEHVSWWHVDPTDRAGEEAAPPREADEGLRGVYLFHSVPTADPDGSAEPVGAGVTHAPQHRRDVS